MPSIGILELVIIIFAVVVFVKPEDLPKFFRTMGNLYGQAQRYFYQMKMYSRQTFDEISRLDEPPPDPAAEPDWQSEHDPYHHDDYHDDYHDDHYHQDHDHLHDHDPHHDAEHHEYESAYAVGDVADADAAVADTLGSDSKSEAADKKDTASEADTAKLMPEAAPGTVGRGSKDDAAAATDESAAATSPETAEKPSPPSQ